eukprot:6432302-Prymnesium_polylepis.1
MPFGGLVSLYEYRARRKTHHSLSGHRARGLRPAAAGRSGRFFGANTSILSRGPQEARGLFISPHRATREKKETAHVRSGANRLGFGESLGQVSQGLGQKARPWRKPLHPVGKGRPRLRRPARR